MRHISTRAGPRASFAAKNDAAGIFYASDSNSADSRCMPLGKSGDWYARAAPKSLRLDETKPVWANSCGVGLRASPSFQLWKSEHEHAIFKGTIIARGTALRRTKKAGSKKVV